MSISLMRESRGRFLRIWGGESSSATGAALVSFVVPIFLAQSLELSAFEISAIIAVASSAPLLLSLSSGAIADRFNRRTLLVWSSAVRAALIAIIPVLMMVNALQGWMIAVILFAVNALTLLFDAAMTAVIPKLVPKSSLLRANSLMELSRNTAETAAPLLGGTLMSVVSAPVVFIINALTYLVSSLTVRAVPTTLNGTPVSDELPQSHLKDIGEGLGVVWKHQTIRPILLTAGTFNFFLAWTFAVFAVFAVRELGYSPLLLGVVFSAVGAMGILGAGIAPQVIRFLGAGRSVIVAFCVIALSALALPWLASMNLFVSALTCVLVFSLWEFWVTVAVIVGDSARQTLIADKYRSRAAGAERFVTWGLDPIGTLIGGAVASTALGLGGSIAIAAVGMLVPAVLALASGGLRRLVHLPLDDEEEGGIDGQTSAQREDR